VVQVLCDTHGGDEEVEAETVVLVVGGQSTEVDLCPICQTTYLSPLLDAGRLIRRPGPKARRR
jgi:hypothetical protein